MVGTRQFDEDKVLDGVLRIFWSKGLRGTSMLDLATGTGVQRGSLYNAYGDKEELFLLAFDRYSTAFLDAARKALADPNIRQALPAFFEVSIANMTSGCPPRGCLTTKTATDSDYTSDRVQRSLRMFLDRLEAVILEALSTKQARKILVLEPVEAAQLIVTFLRGMAVMERIYHDPNRLKNSTEVLGKILLGKAR